MANQLATRAIIKAAKRKSNYKSKAKYNKVHRTKDTDTKTSHKEQSVQ